MENPPKLNHRANRIILRFSIRSIMPRMFLIIKENHRGFKKVKIILTVHTSKRITTADLVSTRILITVIIKMAFLSLVLKLAAIIMATTEIDTSSTRGIRTTITDTRISINRSNLRPERSMSRVIKATEIIPKTISRIRENRIIKIVRIEIRQTVDSIAKKLLASMNRRLR